MTNSFKIFRAARKLKRKTLAANLLKILVVTIAHFLIMALYIVIGVLFLPLLYYLPREQNAKYQNYLLRLLYSLPSDLSYYFKAMKKVDNYGLKRFFPSDYVTFVETIPLIAIAVTIAFAKNVTESPEKTLGFIFTLISLFSLYVYLHERFGAILFLKDTSKSAWEEDSYAFTSKIILPLMLNYFQALLVTMLSMGILWPLAFANYHLQRLAIYKTANELSSFLRN